LGEVLNVTEDASDDEALRRLEKEKRYVAGLANLLTCLREGHVPLTGYGQGAGVLGINQKVAAVACGRCGLVVWIERPQEIDHAAEERARRVAEARAEAEQREQMERDLGGTFRG
jgi:hypothetical protein